MKRILILTCAILMVSNGVNACDGISIQDTKGQSYCMSKFTMNWYSAKTWCESHHMHLVKKEDFCGGTDSCSFKISEDTKTYITRNGGGLGYFWTDMTISGSLAHIIHTNGYYETNTALLRRLNTFYAMCQ